MNLNILKHAVDYGILCFLAILSIISFAIFLERTFYYKKARNLTFNTKEDLEIELTKYLTFLGSIASNAPYIGLLGTVLSIMITFERMSYSHISVPKITDSLALALKSTAAGIVVAVMSMFFYNTLLRKVEIILKQHKNEKI